MGGRSAGVRRVARPLRGGVVSARRGGGGTAGGAPALLRGALAARPRPAAWLGFGGREVARAGTVRARAASVPSASWPYGLQSRPAASAADARCDRPRDRRRHRANHEAARRPRDHRQGRPSLLRKPVRPGYRVVAEAELTARTGLDIFRP